jgi:enoyl-CoA hydratase/carnithine racemase
MARLTVSPPCHGVVDITINRPEVHNSLSSAEIKAFSAALQAASVDDRVRVLVLKGEGESSFCAGADLSELGACTLPEDRQAFFRRFASILESLINCSKPVIASIQGYALGGGCGIAAACDIVIASKEARFSLPELRLGLVPMVIMAPLIRSVQRKKLAYLVYSSEQFSAEVASTIGLVSLVTEASDLATTTHDLATSIAQRPAAALSQAKDALHIAESMDYIASLNVLADKIGLLSSFESSQEGIRAFTEKRSPKWKLP